MANRPLVMPEIFNGETSWDQWIYHFENVAAVNKWDEAGRLCRLKVRLSNRRAQTAFRAMRTTNLRKKHSKKGSSHRVVKSATKRSFKYGRKKKDEGWADLADGLRNLVDIKPIRS